MELWWRIGRWSGEEACGSPNCLSLKEADYGKNVTVAPDAFKGCINL